MSLSIVKLRIEIDTNEGLYGTEIEFTKGLFILHLENSCGKSTCLHSIAYALGQERALGANNKLPFAPVMTTQLEDSDRTLKVHSSRVFLHINNGTKHCTLVREVTETKEKNIISITEGNIEEYRHKNAIDYFINREGDTTRERGFYNWLAGFLGWDIPKVSTYNESQAPLYLPIIFPLLFVEQKRGWTTIQATTPTYLQIQHPQKRAFEFLLSLDIQSIVYQRLELDLAKKQIKDRWLSLYNKLTDVSFFAKGSLIGITEKIDTSILPESITIHKKNNGEWLTIQQYIELLKNSIDEINALKEQEIDIDAQTEDYINAIYEVEEIGSQVESITNELQNLSFQGESLSIRIKTLNQDKSEYEDLKKIMDMKSVKDSDIFDNQCPTCLQPIDESLLPHVENRNILTVEDNLLLLKSQIRTFKSMLESNNKAIKAKELDLEAITQNYVNSQKKLHSLKVSTSKSNSNGLPDHLFRELVSQEYLLDDSKKALFDLSKELKLLPQLLVDAKDLERKKSLLPSDDFSELDKEKLKKLESMLISHEYSYGFSSFPPSQIKISKETYKPSIRGFDIIFDTSASDGIRLIWGYLLSLLELAREFETNHPGLLIFDEPRQQETHPVSFSSLISKAGTSLEYNQQVILATSENLDKLEEAVKGTSTYLHHIDGKIMQPLESRLQ